MSIVMGLVLKFIIKLNYIFDQRSKYYTDGQFEAEKIEYLFPFFLKIRKGPSNNPYHQ